MENIEFREWAFARVRDIFGRNRDLPIERSIAAAEADCENIVSEALKRAEVLAGFFSLPLPSDTPRE